MGKFDQLGNSGDNDKLKPTEPVHWGRVLYESLNVVGQTHVAALQDWQRSRREDAIAYNSSAIGAKYSLADSVYDV